MRLYTALILFLAFATPSFGDEPAKLEPITIATATDAILFTAEVADTEALRSRGLMFRHLLPVDRAMLFDFGVPRPVSMWMKNTYISLDMLFVREDGTIAAIAENTVPKSLDIVSVQEPIIGVIELAAGAVKKFGIRQNDQVFHRIFKTGGKE